MKKINKRMPGLLLPPPKNESDGIILDLSSKTAKELVELKLRQEKLLNNIAFLAKLPDKGAKIKAFYGKISNELKAKQEEEQACRLMNNLNLNSVQHVEWDAKVNGQKEIYLDSDDDSEPEDVLHILSQNTAQEKNIRMLQPEKQLVTPEELVKLGEIPHVKYIVDKTENRATKPNLTGQFKPYKTTISDVHNPEKEIHRKQHKHWEVTAATPPPIIHGPAKVVSLEESLQLQKEYNLHLKEIQAQYAAEKLLARTGLKMVESPIDTSKFNNYREASDESSVSDAEGSDNEVNDEEPERGGVIFTVTK